MLNRVPLAAIQEQPPAVDTILRRALAVARLVHHHKVEKKPDSQYTVGGPLSIQSWKKRHLSKTSFTYDPNAKHIWAGYDGQVANVVQVGPVVGQVQGLVHPTGAQSVAGLQHGGGVIGILQGVKGDLGVLIQEHLELAGADAQIILIELIGNVPPIGTQTYAAPAANTTG
ncbi:MAG: hypothetical protein FRX49_04305 [Trebouxia sp. A1-2]|nr:MAG: hypothetical protein FRX49_04305 [Trebouxia sp. A1-2]